MPLTLSRGEETGRKGSEKRRILTNFRRPPKGLGHGGEGEIRVRGGSGGHFELVGGEFGSVRGGFRGKKEFDQRDGSDRPTARWPGLPEVSTWKSIGSWCYSMQIVQSSFTITVTGVGRTENQKQ